MVTVRESTIKLEVAISYQWALDAHAAIMRRIDNCRRAIRLWLGTRRDNARANVKQFRLIMHTQAEVWRTSLAASLLGVRPSDIGTLRAILANPEAFAPAGAAKEPWEMTAAEFVSRPISDHVYELLKKEFFGSDQYRISELDKTTEGRAQLHRVLIERELNQGRTLLPEVLGDYPDLAANYGKVAPTPEPTAPKGKTTRRITRVRADGDMSVPNRLGAEIACDLKELRAAVEQVKRAIASRTSLPILGHILLTPEDSRLRLTATDLEIGMETSILANVDSKLARAIAVPAGAFLDALNTRNTGDGAVRLTTGRVDKQAAVEVKIGTGAIKIMTLPAEEFPMLAELQNATEWQAVPDLLDAVYRVKFAASADESRRILTGVLLAGNRLAATDTFRIPVCAVPYEFPGSGVVVPARAFDMLTKATAKLDRSGMQMRVSDTQAEFRVGDLTFRCRLIEGGFPNFDKVIPDHSDWQIQVDRDQLDSALADVSVVAKENSYRTRFDLTGTRKLRVSAQSGNLGKAEAEVAVQAHFGKNIPCDSQRSSVHMVFNNRFILEALYAAAGADMITIAGTGQVSPVVITAQDRPGWQCVLMPMQLD